MNRLVGKAAIGADAARATDAEIAQLFAGHIELATE